MANENRDRLLELAVAAIDEGGEASIRVNHLAAAVGVTPPFIYYHFGNRDGLVAAAQVERYIRRLRDDVVAFERALGQCTSADQLRAVLVATWHQSFTERSASRWVRLNAIGSAYARPELEAAIVRAQDHLMRTIARLLEPYRDRGWMRPGLDLATVAAWQQGLLLSRALVERGSEVVDLEEWDRLTVASLTEICFADPD